MLRQQFADQGRMLRQGLHSRHVADAVTRVGYLVKKREECCRRGYVRPWGREGFPQRQTRQRLEHNESVLLGPPVALWHPQDWCKQRVPRLQGLDPPWPDNFYESAKARL